MFSKKKGFTLIEVVVVIFVSTLLFSMVGGTLVFVTTSIGDLVQQSKDINMARNIEKYYQNLTKSENYDPTYNFDFDESTGNIKYGTDIIFSDTGLRYCEITVEEFEDGSGFFNCDMEFKNGKKFSFIIHYKEYINQEKK